MYWILLFSTNKSVVMADVWRQFKVLFWKNCIIQIRNPKGNISNKPEVSSTVKTLAKEKPEVLRFENDQK